MIVGMSLTRRFWRMGITYRKSLMTCGYAMGNMLLSQFVEQVLLVRSAVSGFHYFVITV